MYSGLVILHGESVYPGFVISHGENMYFRIGDITWRKCVFRIGDITWRKYVFRIGDITWIKCVFRIGDIMKFDYVRSDSIHTHQIKGTARVNICQYKPHEFCFVLQVALLSVKSYM